MADESEKTFDTGMKIVGAVILLSLALFVAFLIFGYWSNEMKNSAPSERSAPESGRKNPGP